MDGAPISACRHRAARRPHRPQRAAWIVVPRPRTGDAPSRSRSSTRCAILSQDDGWAYAPDGRAPAKTGEYRLDAWSAANMPVQIDVGSRSGEGVRLLARAAAHRDLLLLVAGLAAFVALLRELDVEPPAAAVFALGLLASPLVAMLAFTFMSDVAVHGLAADRDLALRARHPAASNATVLLASLAAGCAIGTRQFGVAVIGGLLLAGLLARPMQRPPWRVACCSARRSRCWSDSGSCAPATSSPTSRRRCACTNSAGS